MAKKSDKKQKEKYYAEKEKKEKKEKEEKEIIQCSLKDISEYTFRGGEEKKKGRYLKSVFSEVEGYGVTKWVVGCYILVDYEKYLEMGLTEEEIVIRCIRYLNLPPERKKFQKRITTSRYGKLGKCLRSSLKKVGDETFIECSIVIGENNNPHFWGKGERFAKVPRKNKR